MAKTNRNTQTADTWPRFLQWLILHLNIRIVFTTVVTVVTTLMFLSLLALPIVALWRCWFPELFAASRARRMDESASYTFLISANRVWFDTGLQVAKGDTVHIYVSGGVHTGGSRLIANILTDTRSKYPWRHSPIDDTTKAPDFGSRDSGGNITPGLLYDKAPFGSLVVFIADSRQVADTLKKVATRLWRQHDWEKEGRLKTLNPKADTWMDSVERLEITCDGWLMFAVNDLYLDEARHYIYEDGGLQRATENYAKIKQFFDVERAKGSRFQDVKFEDSTEARVDAVRYLTRYFTDPPRSAEELKQWQQSQYNGQIKHYHRLFYDENLGAYLVTLQIESEK